MEVTVFCPFPAVLINNMVDTRLSEAPSEHIHKENVRKKCHVIISVALLLSAASVPQ